MKRYFPRALDCRHGLGGSAWGVWAGFIVIGLTVIAPAAVSGRALGYGENTAMHVWLMMWQYHAISHGSNPFITNVATYPTNTNLLWNNADFLWALIARPIWAILGGVSTVDILYGLLLAGAGAVTTLQLRRHVKHASSAWLGGVFVMSAPWMQSELVAGHVAEIGIVIAPIGWWVFTGMWRSIQVKAGIWRWVLAVAAWLVFGYWVNKEFLATAVLVGVVILAWRWLRDRRADWSVLRLWLAPLLGAGMIAGVLLIIPLALQFGGHVALGKGTSTPASLYVIDLLAYVVPGYGQLLAIPGLQSLTLHFTGNALETNGYLGLPLLIVLGVIALKLRRHAMVAFGVTLIVIGAVFAAGPWLHIDGAPVGIPMPGLLLTHLPIYAKVVPSRMMMYVLFGVACVLTAGWDVAMERLRPVALATLIVVIGVTLAPSAGILAGIGGFVVPAMPAVLAAHPIRMLPAGSLVLVLPIPTRENHGAGMIWQAEDGFRYSQSFGYLLRPSAYGYTVALPGSPLEALAVSLSSGGRMGAPLITKGALRQQLRTLRLAAIIDTPGAREAVDEVILRGYFGRPRLIDGAYVWLQPRVIG